MSSGMEINNGIKAIIDAMPLNKPVYFKPAAMPSVSMYIDAAHFGRFRYTESFQQHIGEVYNVERMR